MNKFEGTWKYQDSTIITVVNNNNFLELSYSNGRGPFNGMQLDLGSPVINVFFNDGMKPDAGVQAGVVNFAGDKITWSNDTVWEKA
ncbi:MAG: hypothetical protein AAFQ94_12935 [Bacteroidota bacterium]